MGQTFDAVRGSAEALGCDESRVGIVAFGSGLVAAAQALREAAWVAALSPRIAGPLEELEGEKLGIPALLSIASEDSRATPAERAASFAKSVFSEVDTQEFLSDTSSLRRPCGASGWARPAVARWPLSVGAARR